MYKSTITIVYYIGSETYIILLAPTAECGRKRGVDMAQKKKIQKYLLLSVWIMSVLVIIFITFIDKGNEPAIKSADYISAEQQEYTYVIAARYCGNGKFENGDIVYHHNQINFKNDCIYLLTIEDNATHEYYGDDIIVDCHKKLIQYLRE